MDNEDTKDMHDAAVYEAMCDAFMRERVGRCESDTDEIDYIISIFEPLRDTTAWYEQIKENGEYDKYAPEKKIEIQLAGRRTYNMLLNSIEKLCKSIKIDSLERKVVENEQSFYRYKIWECDRETYTVYYNLPIDTRNSDKLNKKIKAAGVQKWPYESDIPDRRLSITHSEYIVLPPQDRIKVKILLLEIRESYRRVLENQRKALKSRKAKEYERLYLEQRWHPSKGNYREMEKCYYAELPVDFLFLDQTTRSILFDIRKNNTELQRIYDAELPEDYPFRQEIAEDIEDVHIFIGYKKLQKEQLESRGLKKYGSHFFERVSWRKYDYMTIIENYCTYSPKKKVEVGIACHNVLILQQNAIAKWKASKQMDYYESTISNYLYSIRKYDTYICGEAILDAYREVRQDALYRSELREKIKLANIRSEAVPHPGSPPLELDDLATQDKIQYRIVQRSIYSAECDMILKFLPKLDGYKKRIAHSLCAKMTMDIVCIDREIYRRYYNELPKDDPERRALFEQIKANIPFAPYWGHAGQEPTYDEI
jgi:hypothetical protein